MDSKSFYFGIFYVDGCQFENSRVPFKVKGYDKSRVLSRLSKLITSTFTSDFIRTHKFEMCVFNPTTGYYRFIDFTN